MTRRERFWRWAVTAVFGPRICCFWFGHPREKHWYSVSRKARFETCDYCGLEEEY